VSRLVGVMEGDGGRKRLLAPWCRWWPNGHTPLSEIGDLLERQTTFIRGHDLRNRPCIYVLPRFHDKSVSREALYRLIIFTLEEALARADADAACRHKQFTTIVDCDGMGWSSLDPDALKYIFTMLAANYPERLGHLYIVNDGILFRTVWRVVEMLIDARTSRKITFMGSSYTDRLLADFDASQLWTGVGGSMAYEYSPEHIHATPSAYVTVQRMRDAAAGGASPVAGGSGAAGK